MKQISFLIMVIVFVLTHSLVALAQEEDSIALWDVVQKGDLDMVKKMIGEGADVNGIDYRGNSPLTLAISGNHIEIAQYLLKNGADINAKGAWGYTPLMYAVVRQNYEFVKMLIDAGANLDAQMERRRTTALMHAANEFSTGIVRLLLEAGADPLMED